MISHMEKIYSMFCSTFDFSMQRIMKSVWINPDL
jgi:hypothetical protein